MPSVGYDLWFFDVSAEFCESVPGSDIVVPLPSETVILKAVYLRAEEADVGGVEAARNRFRTPDIYLLRPVNSTDGPPFRSALIYRSAGMSEVGRITDQPLVV